MLPTIINDHSPRHSVLQEDLKKAIITEKGCRVKRIRDFDVALDVGVIKTMLLEYINAEDLSEKYPEYCVRNGGAGYDLKYYWGVDVYKGLNFFLELLNKDLIIVVLATLTSYIIKQLQIFTLKNSYFNQYLKSSFPNISFFKTFPLITIDLLAFVHTHC